MNMFDEKCFTAVYHGVRLDFIVNPFKDCDGDFELLCEDLIRTIEEDTEE